MSLLKYGRQDIPASIVVFFVALPLCLGIALASGAPLLSGVIAGIVGGIVVGAASGSKLGVSGPAAGLAVIVFDAIATLGSWEAFLCAVVLSGVFQIAFGYLKAGAVANFFPSSVITGMLTGIGLLIILKQIPYMFGWHADFLGEEAFSQANGENTFSAISHAISLISMPVLILSVVSLVMLVAWDKYLAPNFKIFRLIQGPIAVVFFGILISYILASGSSAFSAEQLVSLPVMTSLQDIKAELSVPDLSALFNFEVVTIAFVMAVVASIETLLCVEATDKLDPEKGVTPANRELRAQGLGNIISGFIGGLPITQVIVRSSANIAFGAKSKASSVFHGVFLLVAVAFGAALMNFIPLASLAAILIIVGYKLAKPSAFKAMYTKGWEQFVPFITTVVVMLFTDLLSGVIAGLVVSLFFSLKHSYKNAFAHDNAEEAGDNRHIVMAEDLCFLNKPKIMQKLESIPAATKLTLDFSNTKSIAFDVREYIKDYIQKAKERQIRVETIKF
ncbi:MAG: hypothetical protein CMD81_13195 [Gammaproteobacteria bacterium]|nr:hypothetical protein [Gammaproteobacteria bacterium]